MFNLYWACSMKQVLCFSSSTEFWRLQSNVKEGTTLMHDAGLEKCTTLWGISPSTVHFIFPASASPAGPLHQIRSDKSGSLHGSRFALIRYFGVNPSLCSLTVARNQVKHSSLGCFFPAVCTTVQKYKENNHLGWCTPACAMEKNGVLR